MADGRDVLRLGITLLWVGIDQPATHKLGPVCFFSFRIKLTYGMACNLEPKIALPNEQCKCFFLLVPNA